jgi:hypothetical protein
MIKIRYKVSACAYKNGADVFIKNQSMSLEQKREANYSNISHRTLIVGLPLVNNFQTGKSICKEIGMNIRLPNVTHAQSSLNK